MATKGKKLGKRGVKAAARYLERFGYEIIERNWKCEAGEIELVARDCGALVFVEVKTRTDIAQGFPPEFVTAEKRKRLEKIAMYYLSEFEETDFPVRFDTVSLVVVGEDRALIRHYVNALGTAE